MWFKHQQQQTAYNTDTIMYLFTEPIAGIPANSLRRGGLDGSAHINCRSKQNSLEFYHMARYR